jgi:hypothetical protein
MPILELVEVLKFTNRSFDGVYVPTSNATLVPPIFTN